MCPVELKFGDVQKFEAGKVTVRFDDGLVSPPLRLATGRTKGDTTYDQFAEGEEVAVLMDDNGESGLVLGAVYSEKSPPPDDAEKLWSHRFEDGTKFEYDREAKKLTIETEGEVALTTKGNATIDVTGNVEVKATGTAKLEATGSVTIHGATVAIN